MLEHWPSPGNWLGALLVVLVVAAHVAALGYWTTRALRYRGGTALLRLVATAAMGFVMLEFYVLWVGHAWDLWDFCLLAVQYRHTGNFKPQAAPTFTFRPLSWTTFAVSGAVCALSLIPLVMKWRNFKADIRAFFGRLRTEWVLVNSLAILFVFAAVSGMRGSQGGNNQFEDDYKPGAPLAWAQAGRFVPTDYRICNGMAATEAIYAMPQTFDGVLGGDAARHAGRPSPALIALHWSHLLTWVLLTLAAGALAEAFGGGAIATVAAVAAIPVMTSTAGTAGTDIPCAAMLTAAFAVLFSERHNGEDGGRFSRAALLVAGILLGGAITSKPILAVGALPIALFVFVESRRPAGVRRVDGRLAIGAARQSFATVKGPAGERSNGEGSIATGGSAAAGPSGALGDLLAGRREPVWVGLHQVWLVALPATLLVLMWVVHTYVMIGAIWDHSGQFVVRSANDPNWINGEAAGRWPSLGDIIKLPIVPFYATLFGQKEPYGGRIGLLTMSLSLVGIVMLRKMTPAQRRMGYWAAGSAVLYFFVLGPFGIKTRFHNFVWTVFAALAALAYTRARGTQNREVPWWHIVYWAVAAGIVYYIVTVEYEVVTLASRPRPWGVVIAMTVAMGALVAGYVRGRGKVSGRMELWRLAVCSAFIFLALAGMIDSIARKLILPG